MGLKRVWVIPFLAFAFSCSAFLASYAIATANHHVSAFWPYISDSGTYPPESCVFGQLLNMAALFLACSVYVRHRQIVEFYWHQHNIKGNWRCINTAILTLGYLAAFGVSMVANFQETNVLAVHYFGAFLAFGCGLVYAWAQTVFSYMMNPKLAKPIVSHFRCLLCMASTIFFFSTIVFGAILGKHENDANGRLHKWTGSEKNYSLHMVGTCSEWLMAICFQLYILSFAIELRHAYCHAPKLRLIAKYYSNRASSVSDISVESANPVPYRTSLGRMPMNAIKIVDAGDFRRSLHGSNMPVGLDAADFVDPAR